MHHRWLRNCLLAIAVCIIAIAAIRSSSAAGDAPRITKEEAKALLGAPNVVFVDARIDASWSKSDKKIKGAVRFDPYDVESWAGNYARDTKFIVY
jgi:hypothetical protein